MIEIKTYNEWLSEGLQEDIKIPSGKWIDADLGSMDTDMLQLIWNMYTTTYSKQGMDFSADDYAELQTKYKATFLKDVDSDKVPDAFIIYKPTKYGNKIALLGTNDKKPAKKELLNKVISLLRSKGWILEASLRMEEILSQAGVPYVDDPKIIEDIVGKDKKPEMTTNGYYTRLLSKVPKRITKKLYGKVK
jgi:hypothetical protein